MVASSPHQSAFPRQWPKPPGLLAGFGSRAVVPMLSVRVVKQVHGARLVDSSQAGAEPRATEADAIVVREPGSVVAVKTADCMPVLLYTDATSLLWAAAVHAGWRGTLAGIVAVAASAACSAGVEPKRMFAAMGPSIGPCCLEVGEEVAERFIDAGFGASVLRGKAKPHLDLASVNRSLLLAAGVPPDQVRSTGPCTRCRSDLYHSYRAAPREGGRQLSWIGWASRSG